MGNEAGGRGGGDERHRGQEHFGRLGYDPSQNTGGRPQWAFNAPHDPRRVDHGGYGTHGRADPGGSTPEHTDDWSGSRGQGGYATHGDDPPWAWDAMQSPTHDSRGGQSFGGWGQASSRQRGPKGYVRSDERLKDEIHERILQSDVDASDVTIEVQDGHVTLQGTIADRLSKYQLEELVDHVIGVRDVDNRIRTRRDRPEG
jgi:hypothetical protein